MGVVTLTPTVLDHFLVCLKLNIPLFTTSRARGNGIFNIWFLLCSMRLMVGTLEHLWELLLVSEAGDFF